MVDGERESGERTRPIKLLLKWPRPFIVDKQSFRILEFQSSLGISVEKTVVDFVVVVVVVVIVLDCGSVRNKYSPVENSETDILGDLSCG